MAYVAPVAVYVPGNLFQLDWVPQAVTAALNHPVGEPLGLPPHFLEIAKGGPHGPCRNSPGLIVCSNPFLYALKGGLKRLRKIAGPTGNSRNVRPDMLLDQKRRGVGLGLTSIIKDDFGGSSFHSPIMDCSELSQEGHPLGSKPNGLVSISSRRFDPCLGRPGADST